MGYYNYSINNIKMGNYIYIITQSPQYAARILWRTLLTKKPVKQTAGNNWREDKQDNPLVLFVKNT